MKPTEKCLMNLSELTQKANKPCNFGVIKDSFAIPLQVEFENLKI
jgi:hypothetical protein